MNPFKVHYREHPFEVGDKVVSVATGIDRRDSACFSSMPTLHQVYVIRDIGFDYEDKPVVYLVGIFGDIADNGTEWAFGCGGFILLSEYRANYAEAMAARRGLSLDFLPARRATPQPRPKRRAAAKA